MVGIVIEPAKSSAHGNLVALVRELVSKIDIPPHGDAICRFGKRIIIRGGPRFIKRYVKQPPDNNLEYALIPQAGRQWKKTPVAVE